MIANSNDTNSAVLRSRHRWRYVEAVPGNLLCALCKEILYEPVQASCGDRFHQDCYKSLIRESAKRCPLCGEDVDPKKCFRDVFADKELGQLKVTCQWQDDGCPWTGQHQEQEDHMRDCSFFPVSCPHHGCSETVPMAKLQDHKDTVCVWRPVSCSHCGEVVPGKDMEAHLDSCAKVSVSCPNGCEEHARITREELSDHLKCCPRRPVDCSIVGCLFQCQLQQVDRHMETSVQRHILQVSDEVKLLQINLSNLQSETASLQNEQHSSLVSRSEIAEKVSPRMSRIEEQVTELESHQKLMQRKTLEACYQSVDNVQKESKSKTDAIEQHVRILTEKCVKFEELISMQMARIHQLEEEVAANRTGKDPTGGFQDRFVSQDRVLATHDIKLAEHGLRLDMMDCKNTDGVLLWKITEIRRRRRDALSGKTPSIYSQPFYTSPGGYKMCARLYLNGDGMGRGTHLSLFFVVMRGEYDSLLPWPFRQKVTLILVDQHGQRHVSDTFRPDPTSSSFQCPRNEMNVASGCPLFVSLATLDGGGYIKDDCMFLKIVVDGTDLVKPDSR